MMACFRGYPDTVNVLLDHRAAVSAETQEGYTAMLGACATGKTEIVSLLLDRGVDVNAVNSVGYTACWWHPGPDVRKW